MKTHNRASLLFAVVLGLTSCASPRLVLRAEPLLFQPGAQKTLAELKRQLASAYALELPQDPLISLLSFRDEFGWKIRAPLQCYRCGIQSALRAQAAGSFLRRADAYVLSSKTMSTSPCHYEVEMEPGPEGTFDVDHVVRILRETLPDDPGKSQTCSGAP